MDTDEDCEPPIVRLGMPPPPPPPPLPFPLLLPCVEGASPKPSSCLALLAMSSSSDSSSCSDSDSTSTPSTACSRCRLGFDTPGAWLAHLRDHRCHLPSGSSSSSALTEVCSAASLSPPPPPLLTCGVAVSGAAGSGTVEVSHDPGGLLYDPDHSYSHLLLQPQQHQVMMQHAPNPAGVPADHRCPLCAACFTRSQNLESHIRRKHMGAESVVCPDCGKCLSSNSSLKKHQRLHSGETPFSCDLCHSAFRQKCELEKHLDNAHGDKELAAADKPHRCDLCGRAFLYQNSCNAHRKLHQRAYQCPHCGISLLSASDLRRHELSAHQPQTCWPYACSLCPERFTRKAHLDAHLAACQSRQQQQQQQQQQQNHRHHHRHHSHHHLGDDPDLLRCLLRAVDSSSSTASAGRGDPPDMSLLDSVLRASSDFDAVVAYAVSQHHPAM